MGEAAKVEQHEVPPAAEQGNLSRAAFDPALRHAVWLLTQLGAAARDPDYLGALRRLGINVGAAPSLMAILAGLGKAVDIEARRSGGRTDLGEMAQLSAAASLTQSISPELPALFGRSPPTARILPAPSNTMVE